MHAEDYEVSTDGTACRAAVKCAVVLGLGLVHVTPTWHHELFGVDKVFGDGFPGPKLEIHAEEGIVSVGPVFSVVQCLATKRA